MSNDSRLYKIIDLYTNESFHEPFNLAGMLLRLLVVVDAHEKDVIGAESIIAFIDVCTHSFKYVAGVISL